MITAKLMVAGLVVKNLGVLKLLVNHTINAKLMAVVSDARTVLIGLIREVAQINTTGIALHVSSDYFPTTNGVQ
jgi:hypothetical protein